MNRNPIDTLRPPAIGLLVTGCLNAAMGFVTLVSGLTRIAGLTGRETLPHEQSERIGYFIGTIGSYCVAVASLLLAPVIIYAAVQMMKGQKRTLAMIASVLAILPLTSCCCFPVGIAFGIWSLIVLSKPEIKAFFNGEPPLRF